MRVLVVHGLRGLHALARLVCLVSLKEGVDVALLAGDVKSPTIVRYLAESCGLRVMGFAGRLDNESVVRAFKDYGEYVESVVVKLGGKKVLNIGYNPLLERLRNAEEVDVLVTYFAPPESVQPGLALTSPLVDRLVARTRPRGVLITSCRETRRLGKFVCLGDASRGSYAIIDLGPPEPVIVTGTYLNSHLRSQI
ncbi:phosphoesterase [Thermogladius calderae 1633]|uniref:Phosphoesterase n=1 Tax=Thermogladius calderae (strain DSM 22663 / VKM B-2946 / 1633) TaxID=1184251 RepID=I3TEE9_THEC1|nr:phosphoesterase [Thermogladius calderae]AFK51137.1 phosphoesterase [Thermogladius calderae 1633]